MHPDVRQLGISAEQIAPVVLRSTVFYGAASYPQGRCLGMRHVYDYELEYYSYGGGAMLVEGDRWPIGRGDVCFRRPGQHVGGIMPYNCILICFDMTGTAGKRAADYDFSIPQAFQPSYRNPVLDTIPTVFHPGDEGIRVLFETILRLHVADGDSVRLQQKSSMLQLLNRLYLAARFPSAFTEGGPLDPDGRIRQVLLHIRSHLAETLSLEELASIAGLSPAHFHKQFSRIVGEPVNRHVTRLRMEKARELLVGTNWPVQQVGTASGYPNPSHFGWLFRKWTGMSPGAYKKLHRYV